MRQVRFTNKALDDMQDWAVTNPRFLTRALKLIRECQRTPFEGTGKPEALKANLSGFLSRRITDEHRLIYQATEDTIVIHSLRGYYDD